MSIILTQFGATTEELRFNEVWSNSSFEMIRNVARKDSGDEIWLLGIVLELPRYRDRFRTFLGILFFSPDFAYMENRHFAYYIVLRNGLGGCVCFSKPCNNVYLFALFGDQATYFAFTDASEAETFKRRTGIYNLSIHDCLVYFSK